MLSRASDDEVYVHTSFSDITSKLAGVVNKNAVRIIV